MTTYEGMLNGKGMKFALVVGRFNELISSRLYEGALDCLRRHDVADGDVDSAWVPGAFEMPLVAKKLAASGKYDAVICLGAVIRGGTPHFDYVAGEAAKGIARIGLDTGVPVVFGVLTTDTIEQAVERAGTKARQQGLVRGRHGARDGEPGQDAALSPRRRILSTRPPLSIPRGSGRRARPPVYPHRGLLHEWGSLGAYAIVSPASSTVDRSVKRNSTEPSMTVAMTSSPGWDQNSVPGEPPGSMRVSMICARRSLRGEST